MVKTNKSIRETENEFAQALTQFLPKELDIGPNIINYPCIKVRSLTGVLEKEELADFNGNKLVRIKDGKWKNAILEAIKKYKAKYKGDIEIKIVNVPLENIQ